MEWFNPARPGDLLRAIRKVLEDPARQEELIRRGIERAKSYTWDNTIKETLEVYRSLLEP